MSKTLTEQVLNNIDDKFIYEAAKHQMSNNKNATKKNAKIIKFVKGSVAVAATVFIVSTLSLAGATAAGSMTAFDKLYSIFPEIATHMSPVYESCEDNGIRMEVESIYVNGSKAEIYISMQDLTGDRIDETIDLFDSENLYTGYDQIGTCRKIDYNSEAKKATFLIEVENMNGKSIDKKRVEFSVSRFLSNKKNVESTLTQIDLNNLEEVTEYVEASEIKTYVDEEENTFNFMTPDKSKYFTPVEGATVTNYGFVDGKLHVQICYGDVSKYDNHGWLSLTYEGEDVGGESDCFNLDSERYYEYVFDVTPADDLTDYTLSGEFTTCTTLTEGYWKVSFPIHNTQE